MVTRMNRTGTSRTVWAIALTSLLLVAGVGAGADPAPSGLIGTWKVDLRPTPDAEPYYQEFVVTSVEGRTFEGRFYNTAIANGRINEDWGAIRFAFTTSDGSGPYNTAGLLAGETMTGTTHSLGREFLAVWTAERVE